MLRMLRPIGLVSLIALLLAGCSVIPKRAAPKPEPVAQPMTEPAPPPVPAPPPELSLPQIVQLLEDGAFAKARREIVRYLGKHPGDSAARSLLIQVSVDPQEMLGSEYDLHTVERGETLSKIARQHLGSGMAFVLLARYNGIARPREIEVGQSIRIPRRPLGDLLNPGKVGTPPEMAAAPLRVGNDGAWPPPTGLAPEQLAARYQARVEFLLGEQRFEEALKTLDEASDAQPATEGWPWLPQLVRRAQSLRWQQIGMTRMQADDPESRLAAYDAFGEALALDPDLAAAKAARAQLRGQLVLDYHEAALVQYRNQQLDAALTLWDKALALDPNFEPAQGYRLRALELKRRLENLQPAKNPARP